MAAYFSAESDGDFDADLAETNIQHGITVCTQRFTSIMQSIANKYENSRSKDEEVVSWDTLDNLTDEDEDCEDSESDGDRTLSDDSMSDSEQIEKVKKLFTSSGDSDDLGVSEDRVIYHNIAVQNKRKMSPSGLSTPCSENGNTQPSSKYQRMNPTTRGKMQTSQCNDVDALQLQNVSRSPELNRSISDVSSVQNNFQFSSTNLDFNRMVVSAMENIFYKFIGFSLVHELVSTSGHFGNVKSLSYHRMNSPCGEQVHTIRFITAASKTPAITAGTENKKAHANLEVMRYNRDMADCNRHVLGSPARVYPLVPSSVRIVESPQNTRKMLGEIGNISQSKKGRTSDDSFDSVFTGLGDSPRYNNSTKRALNGKSYIPISATKVNRSANTLPNRKLRLPSNSRNCVQNLDETYIVEEEMIRKSSHLRTENSEYTERTDVTVTTCVSRQSKYNRSCVQSENQGFSPKLHLNNRVRSDHINSDNVRDRNLSPRCESLQKSSNSYTNRENGVKTNTSHQIPQYATPPKSQKSGNRKLPEIFTSTPRPGREHVRKKYVSPENCTQSPKSMIGKSPINQYPQRSSETATSKDKRRKDTSPKYTPSKGTPYDAIKSSPTVLHNIPLSIRNTDKNGISSHKQNNDNAVYCNGSTPSKQIYSNGINSNHVHKNGVMLSKNGCRNAPNKVHCSPISNGKTIHMGMPSAMSTPKITNHKVHRDLPESSLKHNVSNKFVDTSKSAGKIKRCINVDDSLTPYKNDINVCNNKTTPKVKSSSSDSVNSSFGSLFSP